MQYGSRFAAPKERLADVPCANEVRLFFFFEHCRLDLCEFVDRWLGFFGLSTISLRTAIGAIDPCVN